MLYEESFLISSTSKIIQREAYDIVQLTGDIGGLMQFVFASAVTILAPFALLSFQADAIKHLCKINLQEYSL